MSLPRDAEFPVCLLDEVPGTPPGENLWSTILSAGIILIVTPFFGGNSATMGIGIFVDRKQGLETRMKPGVEASSIHWLPPGAGYADYQVYRGLKLFPDFAG